MTNDPTDLKSLLASLPSCAAVCVNTLIAQSTCAVNDLACVCHDSQLEKQIELCGQGNCTIEDAWNATRLIKVGCGHTRASDTTTFVAVTAVFLTLAILFSLLRLYIRPPFSPLFHIDDAVMAFTILPVITFTSINLAAADYGLGQDIWLVPPAKVEMILKFFYVNQFFYTLIGATTRAAILLFYLKVFPQPRFHKVTYAVMALCFVNAASWIIIALIECKPISYIWRMVRAPGTGMCRINFQTANTAFAATNIILDVIVLALPFPMVLKLQISRIKKLQVLSMFGVGFL
ncbi:integral membrane protein [Fonsecaea pedrosoi]|nr:integral membrane protein [Fonsecaea pedrosoi]